MTSDVPADLLSQLEHIIRRDPAHRGLISTEETRGPLCPGHLAAAVDHLARFGQQVWIITGFFIPKGSPPAAETDGPPGAALLATALRGCGLDAWLLTDRFCASAVRTVASGYGLPIDRIVISPDSADDIEAWTTQQLKTSESAQLTHVISIERVGPAYRPLNWGTPELRAHFSSTVSSEHWDQCHNMRGEIIDEFTPPLHRILEGVAACRPGVRTIGVGDGGNELGMGAIPWQELRSRLIGPQAARIPCRIATDWTIVSGVSNWGAAALAAGICWKKQRMDLLSPITRDYEEARLKEMVAQGPAVDGVTRLQEATVDGLPFLTYLQPWETMRILLNMDTSPFDQKSI